MSSNLRSRQQHQPWQYQPWQHQPWHHQPYQQALVPVRRTSLALEVKETRPTQVGLIPTVRGCDEERKERKAAGGWWTNQDSTLNEAKLAFDEAIRIYKEMLPKGEKEWLNFENATTMADVLEYTNEAKKSWGGKRRWKTSRKWLEDFSCRIMHYGKVIDVLVQHHPEYASLAWGAMKFLFVLVINHETTAKEVARTLAKIGRSLPQVDLVAVEYPSPEMRSAVAMLYAHILLFLRRATQWYLSRRCWRVAQALWNPFEVEFKELVDDIRQLGKDVIKLAEAGSRQDMREVKGMVKGMVKGLYEGSEPGSLSTTVPAGDQQALYVVEGRDGQAHYIQMMQENFFELPGGLWASEEDRKQLCQAMFGQLRPCLGYKSPPYQNLKISGFLGLPVELDFRGLPKALGRLAVELKEAATVFSYQVALIFCSNETVSGNLRGPVDIAKLLVFHVLEHNPHLLLEQRNMLPVDRLQKARTVPDFLEILEDILRFIPSILFVIDSYTPSTMTEDKAEGTSNDIQQLIEGLASLVQTFKSSVRIVFTSCLPTKRFPGPFFEKHTTKLHLYGGMVNWMDEKRNDFPLPRFCSQTPITQAIAAPREPSDDEPFLKMTTPEGGSISAGTPNRFPLPKRPSWPSNTYSITRYKCKFQEPHDPDTGEQTLTIAEFPNLFDG